MGTIFVARPQQLSKRVVVQACHAIAELVALQYTLATAVGRFRTDALDEQQAMQNASAFYARGRWAEAEQLCRATLKSQRNHAGALTLLGIIAAQTRRLPEAADWLKRAIAARPDDASLIGNYAKLMVDMGRLSEAVASYEQLLRLRPDLVEGYNGRGVALHKLGRIPEALASFEQAVSLKPDHVQAQFNRGVASRALGRLDDALTSYDRVLTSRPDHADAHNNRAIVLQELGRPLEALAGYDRAIALRPDEPGHAEIYLNRAAVLQALDRRQEALESLQRSTQLRPDHVESQYALGNALMRLRRPEAALVSYARALALAPERDWLRGNLLHSKAHLCDWRDRASQLEQLLAEVERGKKAVLPFYALALTDSPALQQQTATIFVDERFSASTSLAKIVPRSSQAKIRLGYYSADFHDHATAHLAAGLFEHHDRARFELIALSFGPTQDGPMRQRLTAAFDRFQDVSTCSDRDIALLSRQLEIDVAIDLKGFTEQARPGIFGFRAAPVQASYLGYPGTMGSRHMDYLVADTTLVPTLSQRFYNEKIVYLPHSYQVNDRSRVIGEAQYSREQLGLPGTGAVFCCFNNAYKIAPDTFDSWMRILNRVPDGVLWLLPDSVTAASNLRNEAAARGVDPERLVFATRLPPPQHLSRHTAADLFLDTLPYNAHTTASDALWAGLPVLSCRGESFAGRVAASLLLAAGLPELITNTSESYETLAVELASDTNRLAALKQKLISSRLTMPLFDTALFTRHLEDAYTQMHERSRQGLGPEHLYVRDLS